MMEKKIKSLLRCLQAEFALFWILPLVLVALYEYNVLPQGALVEDPRTTYMLQMACILLVIVLIPLPLRLFSLSMVRYVKKLPLERALVSYRRWCEVRLFLLFVPFVLNLAVYYWTLDTNSLFCAAMAGVASFFCVPGMKRLRSEMDLGATADPEEVAVRGEDLSATDTPASVQKNKTSKEEQA